MSVNGPGSTAGGDSGVPPEGEAPGGAAPVDGSSEATPGPAKAATSKAQVPEQGRRTVPPDTGPSVPRQREDSPDPAELGPSDTELVERMREGDSGAYDELYRRHAEQVRRYARTCCRDADTADDLTGEVFASTLQAVRAGEGPRTSVRAYLLTSVRHVAAQWTRTAKREQLVEDFAVFAATAAEARADETADVGADVQAMREADRTLAVRAFRSLPEKYQTVLWHTTIEESAPRDVAPLLGMTDNATAVLAHRAREKLKQAFLQAHVSRARTEGGDCARYADRLGAYARGGLRSRAERGLRQHLDQCDDCRTAALEVKDLNQHIRILVPVAFIGWFAAGGAKSLAGILAGTGAAGAAGTAAAATGATSSGGASGGGAASEGLGTPAKAGIVAGVVLAAALALAMALTGGEAPPKKKEEAKPKPPASAPPNDSQPKPPKPEPKPPVPPAKQSQAKPPADKPSASADKPSKPSDPSKPPNKPSPTPPSSSPTPTKPPPDTPPPPPPPAEDYQINELRWGGLGGDEDEPTLRVLESSWVWNRDSLSVDDQRFDHGITVSGPSTVRIDLNRQCDRYQAKVGIDDLALTPNAARFSVYGDGGRLWTSPVMKRGDPAVPVNVALNGSKTVRLVVEPAGGLPTYYANWASSGLSCS
ncbi:sigma-70 family RNA polymerase sigma factor [Streptomyces sp. NPDC005438]|uniref:sigma-70 family RNA polymerase sigma factor n=1 Tax=Streptomyces sp. NPDC005438 TaxID=3156880 RepID=UPI0033A1A157